jgi:hypothetical protein
MYPQPTSPSPAIRIEKEPRVVKEGKGLDAPNGSDHVIRGVGTILATAATPTSQYLWVTLRTEKLEE